MATLSSDGTYVVVEKGDTLCGIARDYAGGESYYKKLAAINNIKDANVLSIGQKIYLSDSSSPHTDGSSGGSSSGSSTESTGGSVNTSSKSTPKVTYTTPSVDVIRFGRRANSNTELFIEWEFNGGAPAGTLAGYYVDWQHYTKDKIWVIDDQSTTTETHSFYSIPEEATMVWVQITPVSDTYTVTEGDTEREVSYWIGKASKGYYYNVKDLPPNAPSAPSVSLKGNNLTASLDNLDDDITYVTFELSKDGKTNVDRRTVKVETNSAIGVFNVIPGHTYKVRAYSWKGSTPDINKGGIWSDEWSPFSNAVNSAPIAPTGVPSVKAESENSVTITWEAASGAETYTIEYTTDKRYFDNGDTSTKSTIDNRTTLFIDGLESGKEYFFRVKSVNSDGESTWTGISSVILGKKPTAPTTWSSSNVCIVGEMLTLYWLHNSADNSDQTNAYIEFNKAIYIYKSASDTSSTPVTNYTVTGKDNYILVDTSKFKEGEQFTWKVKTAGITKEYGEFSTERLIKIYAKPTLELTIKDHLGYNISTIEAFPFTMKAIPGPATQAPIGYQINVTSLSSYSTTDRTGMDAYINENEVIFSKYIALNEDLEFTFTASDIDLEAGQNYKFNCTVAMDSGLTAENSIELSVGWTENKYTPNASLTVNPDLYTANIQPFCEKYNMKYLKCTQTISQYLKGNKTSYYIGRDTLIEDNEIVKTVNTEDTVYTGKDQNGNSVYYCLPSNNTDLDYVLYVEKLPNGQYCNTYNMIPFIYEEPKSIGISTTTGEDIYKAMNSTDFIYFCKVNNDIYTVTPSNPVYTKTNIELKYVSGIELQGVKTTTEETVYSGMTSQGEPVYYCVITTPERIQGVTLAVYRRNFDGSFTEIAKDLPNKPGLFVTDPHPSMDYARYRIVATEIETGAIGFTDLPGYPIPNPCIVIQWDEQWTEFDTGGSEDIAVRPSWTGSMVKLPYNIDVTDTYSQDVSFVEYIGRKHPVSYYGTQLGETSSWSTDIPASDKNTIYALRRLSAWMGDCYVREPSGIGYWAKINVSIPITHREVSITVNLEITRVEGGM